MAYQSTREEFLEWILLDKRTRQLNGLPMTQVEFADWKGISERTLRRWKDDPEFVELREQRQLERARQLEPGSAVSDRFSGPEPRRHDGAQGVPRPADPAVEEVRPDDLDPDEWDYERIKQEIVNRSLAGNEKAQDMYLKHWGRRFVQAEVEGEGALADVPLETLVDQMIDMAGIELVSERLVALQVGPA